MYDVEDRRKNAQSWSWSSVLGWSASALTVSYGAYRLFGVGEEQEEKIAKNDTAVAVSYGSQAVQLLGEAAAVTTGFLNAFGIVGLALAQRQEVEVVHDAEVEEVAASVVAVDAAGNTPLMTAIRRGDSVDVINRLVKESDVNAKNHRGETALYLAAARGDVTILESLLPLADVNSVTRDNETPIYSAVKYGHLAAVELLLQKPDIRCDITSKWYGGATPFMLAVRRGNLEMIRQLGQRPGVNIADYDEITPLQVALERHNLEVLSAVLESPHIDLSIRHFASGRKALEFAMSHRNEAGAKLIAAKMSSEEKSDSLSEAVACDGETKLVENVLRYFTVNMDIARNALTKSIEKDFVDVSHLLAEYVCAHIEKQNEAESFIREALAGKDIAAQFVAERLVLRREYKKLGKNEAISVEVDINLVEVSTSDASEAVFTYKVDDGGGNETLGH